MFKNIGRAQEKIITDTEKQKNIIEAISKEQEMVNRYRSKLYEIEQEARRIQIL